MALTRAGNTIFRIWKKGGFSGIRNEFRHEDDTRIFLSCFGGSGEHKRRRYYFYSISFVLLAWSARSFPGEHLTT